MPDSHIDVNAHQAYLAIKTANQATALGEKTNQARLAASVAEAEEEEEIRLTWGPAIVVNHRYSHYIQRVDSGFCSRNVLLNLLGCALMKDRGSAERLIAALSPVQIWALVVLFEGKFSSPSPSPQGPPKRPPAVLDP